MAFQNPRVRAGSLLWLPVILLQTSLCGFAKTRQEPLSEVRERNGLALRRSARGVDSLSSPLVPEERKRLSNIAIAGEKRDWPSAKLIFGTYSGNATQIYAAAMHAALRCREYTEGAKIYEKCRANCEYVGQPAFAAALRIFAQLGERSIVEQIWDDSLNVHELNELVGSARLSAAAKFGDVEMAAETLDEMNNRNVNVSVYHISSALRACWGWGEKQHKAAKYFFDLLPKFQLSPDIVAFTSLIGAYHTASLQELLVAYDKMKSLQIEPNSVFAETYLFSVLQARKGIRVEDQLHDTSLERLQACRDALNEFKGAGLRMSGVCRGVHSKLMRMDI